MTTKNSPIAELRNIANNIAVMMKKAERREYPKTPNVEKLIHAREHNPGMNSGIVMDDKVITIEIPWPMIAAYSEHELTEYIITLMREEKANQ